MPRTTLALLTALALAPACAPPPEAPAPPAAPAATLAKVSAAPAVKGSIESIEYAGSGCEPSTAVTAISPDEQASTTTFSAFVAQADPNADPEEASRDCVLIAHLKVPAGSSYSFENVIHRGFAGLERRVSASRQSIYVIGGSPVQVTPPAEFTGPTNDDYNQADISPEQPGEWSPCGGGQTAWIATQTEVDNHGNGNRAGQLTVDSIDISLRWKRCE